ncbi:MAG TPA: hypothetical protein VK843_12725 [Planctomycetota bacterium]|nr:hypothetical protein [Planctomycetota bacterium]
MGSPVRASALPAGGLGHDHGDEHDTNEAFPRAAVRDLVGQTLVDGRRREMWQDLALMLGLTFLALAMPMARLLGTGPALVQSTERGEWFSMYVLLQPLTHLLSLLPSVGAERAWYLVASACWGAAYLVLLRTAMFLGVPRLAGIVSSLLVLISPLGFLAGTLPGASGPALLGSAILFKALLEFAQAEGDARRARHPLGVWLGVCLLDPSLVLLLPAVVWSLISAEGTRGNVQPERWRVAVQALLTVVVLAALLASTAGIGHDGQFSAVWGGFGSTLLGRGTIGAPDSLTWLLVLAPALGVGVLGLVELLRRPSERMESAPAAWISAFVAVPIVVRLLGGTPSLDTAAWALGPVAVLGLASFLGHALERWHWTAIVGLIVLQVGLTWGFRYTMFRGDPNRAWTEYTADLLNPGDLVLTRDQQHDYLLHHRFHLKTVNLRVPHELDDVARLDWWEAAQESVRERTRNGGKVFVDWKVSDPPGGRPGYAFQNELHELVLLAPTLHLEKPPPPPKKVDPDGLDQL